MKFGEKIKQNTYLYFASKLILLLVAVYVFDFSIGKILRYFYFKQEVGRLYRATFAIDKTTSDVLVFGSSRAYHHYVPSVIEEKLNKSCYNTGSPGQFLLYNYATLQAILKRYSPKMIILDVSPGDLKVERESYDRLSFLLPYYSNHPEIRPIVDLKSPWEKYKVLSSIYPFNSAFLMIAGGNSEFFKKRTTDMKGYKPLTRTWNKPILTLKTDQYKLDSIKISIFNSFISDCKNSGIKLLIVCSPSYIQYSQEDYSISIIKKISRVQNINFIDFTNDSTFTNRPYLFDDPGHLNTRGAELFTTILINKITNSIN